MAAEVGYLGANGLDGLKNLLSFGGNRVNAKVADYSQRRAELDLADATLGRQSGCLAERARGLAASTTAASMTPKLS